MLTYNGLVRVPCNGETMGEDTCNEPDAQQETDD